jgi:acyl-CoA thioesterase FadM
MPTFDPALTVRIPVAWGEMDAFQHVNNTVEVAVGVVTLGRSSVTLGYRVTSTSHEGAVVAEGVTVVVLFDYSAKRAIPIDDALRARIGAPTA